MSECVVRMEMPKACWSCGLRFVCKAANDFLTTKEAGCSVLKVGMEGCLIVCQLPDGHGRLVDADDCIKHLFTEWVKGEISNSEWCNIRQCMNEETTIVPAEAERSET